MSRLLVNTKNTHTQTLSLSLSLSLNQIKSVSYTDIQSHDLSLKFYIGNDYDLRVISKKKIDQLSSTVDKSRVRTEHHLHLGFDFLVRLVSARLS